MAPPRALLLLGLALPAAGLRARAHAGGEPAALPDALSELVRRHGQDEVCLYSPGPFMGRLSNTVAMVNLVMRTALESGAKFVWPQNYTKYMQKEGFAGIFGGGDRPCELHEVQTYAPVCKQVYPKPPAFKTRCYTQELMVDLAAPVATTTSQFCGCKHAVVLSGSDFAWDHDYSKTASFFSKRYWQSRPASLLLPHEPNSDVMEPMGEKPPQVVMHVRLGDVENDCLKKFTIYNCRKKLQVEVYELLLSALFQVLPPSCVEINIATDGKRDSPDIMHITQNLTGAGLKAPKVWTGDSLSTARTFELLTHADVLVFGSSGFGQLAAVLGRPETARIGAPQPFGYESDPMYFLANTTQLSHPRGYFENRTDVVLNVTGARELLAANSALAALAQRCRATAA